MGDCGCTTGTACAKHQMPKSYTTGAASIPSLWRPVPETEIGRLEARIAALEARERAVSQAIGDYLDDGTVRLFFDEVDRLSRDKKGGAK